TNRAGRRFESSRMHHILRNFSNEGIEEVAELTAGTRDDNCVLSDAEGRAARRVILPDAPSLT
ncbi:hypothetical protein, partial [Shigella sp. FC1567]